MAKGTAVRNTGYFQKIGDNINYADGNIGIQTETPDGLIDATPDTIDAASYSYPDTRVTTAQRNALTGMTAGASVYDLDVKAVYCHNGTEWRIETAKRAIIKEKQNTAVDGGNSSIGWNVRKLSTIETDDIGGVTIATNQFALPAGTYMIKVGGIVCNARKNKLRLTNVTDTIEYFGESEDGGNTISARAALITPIFAITASKTFKLDHYVSQAQVGYGMGQSVDDGSAETYATVEVLRIA